MKIAWVLSTLRSLISAIWIKIYLEEQETSLRITDCINSLNSWELGRLFWAKDAFTLDIKGSRIKKKLYPETCSSFSGPHRYGFVRGIERALPFSTLRPALFMQRMLLSVPQSWLRGCRAPPIQIRAIPTPWLRPGTEIRFKGFCSSYQVIWNTWFITFLVISGIMTWALCLLKCF